MEVSIRKNCFHRALKIVKKAVTMSEGRNERGVPMP
jgi:hypothetical protein